ITSRPLRVALQNVGCKLNSYEVEALSHGFDGCGYDIVPFSEIADVYVVNTCTVTGSGDSDSRKAVRRARRTNTQATGVATGCYAQRQPEDLSAAGADLVVGNGEKAHLIERLQAHQTGEAKLHLYPDTPPRTDTFLSIDGLVEGGRTRGMLQVQDGCDEHCTYCIIPSVRGQSVSRPDKQIVKQARTMVAAGYRELALTGVHTGSYGYDVGNRNGLVDLLEALEQINGLDRIRLNSVEPAYVSDALIAFAARSDKFCRHFHIPLQSGSDTVLKRMGRHYDSAYYAQRIHQIAEAIPDSAIGADVMVGFPDEDAVHFQRTYDLLAELPMTYLHVFPFSLREGTPAQKLATPCDSATKKERGQKLIELGKEKQLAFHQRLVGRCISPLVENRTDPHSGLRVGLSDNYVRVLFDGIAEPNEIVEVRIQHAREDLVFGEVV
ncbi:MAG: tRNA (N(6)-L-threonylcarbamoyladenosine(37)-C(2))-methylthiotransferase MtaB, partial [Candidatus Latescibacterota bacterium]|nr:tRNA (N(6)-L-threonylcarbamoyladenosine(37)-C(2))-methylthiotransferase MtaB [Candidatus Latescibacterota bacterium]